MIEIYASRKYMDKKWAIYLLLGPVFVFAFLTSLNDAFGIDLAGGWMGKRDPIAAGYSVLLSSPIFVFYYYKGLKEYFFHPPLYLQISRQKIDIFQRQKSRIKKSSTTSLKLVQDTGYRKLNLLNASGLTTLIRLEYLEISEAKLINALQQFEWPLVN